MIPIREVVFQVSDNLITPSTPQDAGMQGDHNATRIVFLLPQDLISEQFKYTLTYIDGNGAEYPTDLLEGVHGQVSYFIPRIWSIAGGTANVYLNVAVIKENGDAEFIYHSRPGKLLYSPMEFGANKQPVEADITAMLSSTIETMNKAVEGAEAISATETRVKELEKSAQKFADESASYMQDSFTYSIAAGRSEKSAADSMADAANSKNLALQALHDTEALKDATDLNKQSVDESKQIVAENRQWVEKAKQDIQQNVLTVQSAKNSVDVSESNVIEIVNDFSNTTLPNAINRITTEGQRQTANAETQANIALEAAHGINAYTKAQSDARYLRTPQVTYQLEDTAGLTVYDAEDAYLSTMAVQGKCVQTVTQQGANLVPGPGQYPGKWSLNSGAVIDGDVIDLSAESASAVVSIPWVKGTAGKLGMSLYADEACTGYLPVVLMDAGQVLATYNMSPLIPVGVWTDVTYDIDPAMYAALAQTTQINIVCARGIAANKPYKVKDIYLYTDTSKTGYEPFAPASPSPEYPSYMTGLADGGSVTVESVQGRNMFDKSKHLNVSDFTGMSPTAGYKYAVLQLEPNKTYKVSVHRRNGFNGTGAGIVLINRTKHISTSYVALANKAPYESENGSPYTTGDDGCLYLQMNYNATSQTNLDTVWANTDVQIEEGTEATEYQPYRGATVTTTIPEPLRAVPAAADTLDLATGKGKRRIACKALNGTEQWVRGPVEYTTGEYTCFCTQVNGLHFDPSSVTLNCSHLMCVADDDAASMADNIAWAGNSAGAPSLMVKVNKAAIGNPETLVASALAEWIAAQATAGTPVTIWYALAEPTDIVVAPAAIPTYRDEMHLIMSEPLTGSLSYPQSQAVQLALRDQAIDERTDQRRRDYAAPAIPGSASGQAIHLEDAADGAHPRSLVVSCTTLQPCKVDMEEIAQRVVEHTGNPSVAKIALEEGKRCYVGNIVHLYTIGPLYKGAFRAGVSYTITTLVKCIANYPDRPDDNALYLNPVYTDGTKDIGRFYAKNCTEFTRLTLTTSAEKTLSYLEFSYGYASTWAVSIDDFLVTASDGSDILPTPDWPSPMVPVAGDGRLKLAAQGRNLLDATVLRNPANYTIPTFHNGTYKSVEVIVPPGKYTLSLNRHGYNAIGKGLVLAATSSYNVGNVTGIFVHFSAAGVNIDNMVIDATDGAVYISLYADKGIDAASALNELFGAIDIQLEPGETATPYEPYSGTTVTTTIPEPLRAVSVATDTLDLVTGRGKRAVKEIVTTGSDAWDRPYGDTFDRDCICFSLLRNDILRDDNLNHMVCSHVPTANSQVGGNGCFLYAYAANAWLNIRIDKSIIGVTDADDSAARTAKFKNWLDAQAAAGTPVTIWYALAEPTDIAAPAPDILLPGPVCNLYTDQPGASVDLGYNRDLATVISRLELAAQQTYTQYGVRFDGPENSGPTVTRLYNAQGLVAGVGTDTTTARNDFDNIYPWSARRRCCGAWDDAGNFIVHAYAGEPGYTTDGTNGEVWVEHSLFYYKHLYDGDAEEIIISAFPIGGYLPAPIFVRPDGTLLQKAYTAAYPMATVDGKATSRAGVFPDTCSLNEAMATARTLGENYAVTTTAEWYTECLYMWVEFATRNLQTIMAGASDMPYVATDTATVTEDSANRIVVENAVAAKYVVGQTIGIGTSLGEARIANNRVITAIEDYDADNKAMSFDGDPVNVAVGNIVFSAEWMNGSCDSVLSSSGSPVSNTSGKYNCMYRGTERPYGCSFNWISDVLFKREGKGTAEDPYTYDIYYLPDATKYSAGEITSDYVKLNFQLSPNDGYVKKLGFDSRYPHLRLPAEIGAVNNTYYSDYYYYPRYALCAAPVGGRWLSRTYAGPLYWHCYPAPSTSHIIYRARLSYHRH